MDVMCVGTTGMPLLQLAVRSQRLELVGALLQWGEAHGEPPPLSIRKGSLPVLLCTHLHLAMQSRSARLAPCPLVESTLVESTLVESTVLLRPALQALPSRPPPLAAGASPPCTSLAW